MKRNTLEDNAVALKRWRSRLKRAMTMIEKLERQRKRLEAKSQSGVGLPSAARADHPKKLVPRQPAARPEPLAVTIMREITEPPKEIDTSIPSFLKRTPDPVAEQIKAEQAETKRAKARGRIERMKAKQRGDLKKMPLTGKAALAAIRGA